MEKELQSIIVLFSDFQTSIGKRSPFFLADEKKTLSRIFEWDLIIWKKYTDIPSKDPHKQWILWAQLRHIFDEIISQIGKTLYEKNEMLFVTSFIKASKNHTESKKNVYIKNNNTPRFYIENFLRLIYPIFFKYLETKDVFFDTRGFWQSFPENWKITIHNLTEEVASRVLYQEYRKWAFERIQEDPHEDIVMNNITLNLFPAVEPRTWAIILIFIHNRLRTANFVQRTINHNWGFGFDTQPKVFTGHFDPEEYIQTLETEKILRLDLTYDLALFLFKSLLTEELLIEYKQSANELAFEPDSKGEKHKEKLIQVFDGLLSKLRQQNNQE